MKKSTSKFRDRVAGNSHKQKTQGSQYGYLNLPRGVNIYGETPDSKARIDILPYTVSTDKHPDRNPDNGAAMPGSLWYKFPFKLHRNVGANNEAVVCPTSLGRPCPICNHRSTLRREGGDQDAIKALRPSDRNLYVVLVHGEKDYEESKPHIWDISQFCFQEMLNDEIDENDDYAVFPDPEEGLTLKIRFSEESFAKNKFAKANRIDFEAREAPISDAILSQVPCLDEVLSVLPYKDIENKFLEIDQEPEGGKVDEEGTSSDTETAKETVQKEETRETSPPAPRRMRDVSAREQEAEAVAPRRRAPEPEPEVQAPRRRKSNGDDDEDPATVCIACNGSGENTKGQTCPICRGTGKRPSSPPAAKVSEPPAKAYSTSKDKCPYGHKFGVDCEQFTECDACEIWDSCYAAKQAAK